jgi:hypothetical protein
MFLNFSQKNRDESHFDFFDKNFESFKVRDVFLKYDLKAILKYRVLDNISIGDKTILSLSRNGWGKIKHYCFYLGRGK